MSSGHIPNSFSLSFDQLRDSQVDPEGRAYTTLKGPADLKKTLLGVVGSQDVLDSRQFVNSCGSGMSAAM